MSKILARKSLWQFAGIIIFCCLIYSPLLGKKAKNPDGELTLPPLFAVSSPLDYLKMLRNFETIDFQPVRDLTFFVDIWLYKATGFVTFATTNIILWGIACYLLLKLLERLVSEERRDAAIFWILAFSAYPLFSQAVPWGMARKHILAFPIFLWGTHAFLDWMENKKTIFPSYLAYVLSALSHPLVLLWPFWAWIHHYLSSPEKKEERKKLTIFFLTGITLLFTNYAYYTIGNQAVAEIFSDVKPELFDFPRHFLNFCFYLRQIVYPYELSFQNFPTLKNSWPGFLLFIALLGLLYHERKDKQYFSWFLFMLLPFPIVLTLPGVFDQYLLIPGAGLLILLFRKWGRPGNISKGILLLIALAGGTMTYFQAGLWTNMRAIGYRNFQHVPSCKSSSEVLLAYYSKGEKPPRPALIFFLQGHCLNLPPTTPVGQRIAHMFIESMMLYHEDELTLDREQRLRTLAQYHYYFELIYAAFISREGRNDEIEEAAKRIIGVTKGVRLETGPIIDDVLRPYCQKEQLPNCLKVTEPYHPKAPYLL